MAGGNNNFAPGFTVPALMTLDGYTLMTFDGTTRYITLDIRRAIPKTKFAAVRAALSDSGKNRVPDFLIGHDPNGAVAAKGVRPDFRNAGLPSAGAAGTTGASSRTAAEVTTLLAAIETAITT